MEHKQQTSKPASDVFDSPEFNAIQLVNHLFPEESSLNELETFADALRTQVGQIIECSGIIRCLISS
eukprot:1140435-Pelagomonas_calceolata.AAC.1